MALVEPLIGHLLSKYKETVLEGLSKIRQAVQAGGDEGHAVAVAVTQQEEALQALRATLQRHEYVVPTLQTLTAVLSQLPERGSRVALVRELLRGECAALFRRTLATLSDTTLAHVTAALQFLTVAVKDAPLLVLARLRSPADAHNAPTSVTASAAALMSPLASGAAQRRADIPLHLAAFRLQLTYNQRRLRLVRLGFLVQLITSPMHNAVVDTMCSHGTLTHLLEDAAELLREGTSAGVPVALSALRVVRELFVESRHVTAEQKRRVLMGQRNVFRLLVRALEFEPVADNAAAILYAVVDETIESPADYASTRVESLEDQGMPNYLLFFLLRQLRPKASERMAQLVLHILQRAPDLIRPYFIRVSGHLAEDGSAHGVAPSTARVAVLNLMTRAFLLPMPYHLAAQQVRLEPVVAKTSTFYTMCPRDVADEVCPMWVAEYVHRLINGSTNLLLLALAMQLTQAALTRAKRVLPLVQAAQNAAQQQRGAAATTTTAAARAQATSSDRHGLTGADLDVLRGTDDAEAEVWDTYNAQVRHHLQSALPSREEFWHRMTQQLHRTLTTAATASSSTGSTASGADASLAKTQLVVQRMFLLMKDYVDVFDIRAPWLSAVPAFLPDLTRSAAKPSLVKRASRDAASGAVHPLTAALQQQNDILRPWPAASVALLCELLVASQQRRVPTMKLHHINMSQAVGVGEWPLLLSVLLWVAHHAPRDGGRAATQEDACAMGWAAQLVMWTVHSITIHSACTVAEAHLWLTALTPNTVPVFLHVLNHLLMRSLSKAADRVTDELRNATHGVLVAAAQHFIERTKEKQEQKADGGEATKPMAKAGANLWGTHLHASLAEFEGVVARVVAQWKTRARLLAEAAAAVAAGPADGLPRVTRQHCIEVLVLADRQRGLAKTALASSPFSLSSSSSSSALSSSASPSLRHGSTSQPSQLRAFAHSLRSPVVPLPGEEAEMALLELLSNNAVGSADADEQGAAQQHQPQLTARLVAHVCTSLGLAAPVAESKCASVSSAKPWFTMNSVCWHVAGMLAGATVELDSAYELSHRIVQSLVLRDSGAAVQAHLQANADREGATTGLLVLLLSCVRVLLRAQTEKTPCESPSPDTCAVLGRVCMSVYTGSLSVQDRLLYAICLTLHYLINTTGTEAEQPHEDISHNDDEEDATAAAAAAAGAATAPESKPRAAHGRTAARTVAPPPRYNGAEAPTAVVQHRFLLMGHTVSAARTPELDMLAWQLDTLTEDDVTRMALHASSRLHNAVVVTSSGSSSGGGAAEALLAAVFPELQTAEDVDVADLERLALADVLDPRYMVPLVHRVVSLPPTLLAHLPTGRAIPLLLKALTSVDAALRAAAATALSSMYIPKGALRVVVSVARLKLVQLQSAGLEEGRHRSHSHASSRRAASARAAAAAPPVVPRLPTPLAITLIASIRPLGRYDDTLHHHLTHFLMHIETALDTPLPFAHWATAPPLAALSVPLMLERQEALQQHGGKKLDGGGGGGVTQASAADVARELRKGIPPQLAFLLQLLRHGCEVPQDGAAVLESCGLEGLMLLCEMLAASDTQRAALVRCLVVLCTQSAALTRVLARSGHVLAWAVAFVWELCREYGTASAYPYSGHTFATALELLRAVVRATAPAMSEAAAEQLQESLRQLRAWVVAAHVTARDVLDVLDEMTLHCGRIARAAALAATVPAEAKAPAESPVPPVVPPAVPAKKRGRDGEGTRATTKRGRVEGTA